jgi:hypothetical protein
VVWDVSRQALCLARWCFLPSKILELNRSFFDSQGNVIVSSNFFDRRLFVRAGLSVALDFVEGVYTVQTMAERKAAAVSMDPVMFDEAKSRATALGFPTFSAYVVQLLRDDLRRRGAMTLQEDAEIAPVVKTNRKANYRETIKTKAKKGK